MKKIRDTFWPILYPPPHVKFGDTDQAPQPPSPRVPWQFSFYRKHSFLKTFAVKFSSKIDFKKWHVTFWLTPISPVSFGDTVATRSPPPQVSRIIWMAPLCVLCVCFCLYLCMHLCVSVPVIASMKGNLQSIFHLHSESIHGSIFKFGFFCSNIAIVRKQVRHWALFWPIKDWNNTPYCFFI